MIMKQNFLSILAFLFCSLVSGQNLTFENIEKNAGQYYTNIEATLLSANFEFVSYDNNAKKLTYQYTSDDNLDLSNKFCYIWRSPDDKAKIITYFTTNPQEYINWKKTILLKNYFAKPLVNEGGNDTKEWFFSKQYGVKILKKQLDNADKSKKITAYLLTIIKQKK
jgi:hypothetical protein